MRRREFIILVTGAAASVASPPAARAQQSDSVRRIGALIVFPQTDREIQARVAVFRDTLQKLGWTDGRNLRIEYRWSAEPSQVKPAAAELVRTAPDLILVQANTALAELQILTSTIPIVFAQVSDPADGGFVASLALPGGNITGFQNFEPAIGGKWLGLLKEAAPNVRRVAVLFGSDSRANVPFLRAVEAVAPSLDVGLTPIDLAGGINLEDAIATFAGEPDGGLVILPNPRTTGADRGLVVLLAARHRLPAVYPFRYFATEGGLVSYGPDQIEQWRGAATYVDRILRGEKPGDLPVQAPTKYELVDQPQDRAGARIEHPAGISVARGRGDRVSGGRWRHPPDETR